MKKPLLIIFLLVAALALSFLGWQFLAGRIAREPSPNSPPLPRSAPYEPRPDAPDAFNAARPAPEDLGRELPPDEESRRLCPPNFIYQSGGRHWIVRRGQRWGREGEKRYEIDLAPYCLARYEASQPDATTQFSGGYVLGQPVPPAQVKRWVLPWVRVSWLEANIAVAQQGWRLPTYEELQVAASGGDPDRAWIFGKQWDCRLAEQSWFETCRGLRDPREGAGVTGGPTGAGNYGGQLYDLLGGVTEMTSTPWDVKCYDLTRFSLWGHAFLGGHGAPWINSQQPDPDRSGCWLFNGFEGTIYGEHEHHLLNRQYRDDGFRPAADPSPDWAARSPRPAIAEPDIVRGWYYHAETGEKITYEIPVHQDWREQAAVVSQQPH